MGKNQRAQKFTDNRVFRLLRYFGGYANQNYLATASALDLSVQELVKLAQNSFEASFLDDATKKSWITQCTALL